MVEVENAPVQADKARRIELPSWVDLLLITTAFVGMAWISWRKWPDLLIDFGMQLYVPWRISEGAVLYQDVAYLTGGPLSQTCHGLLFQCFGASFGVLIWSNLLLFGLLLSFIYRRFCACSDRLTATMICVGIVIGFGFAQYLPIGNYNFVAPYSHDAVHGLLIALLMLGFLADFIRNGRTRSAGAVGLCFGLIFLTKPEIGLAAGVTLFVAVCLARPLSPGSPVTFGATLAFLAMAIVPSLALVVYFLQSTDLEQSVRAVCWAWIPLLTTDVADNSFYRWCLGLDAPWLHVKTALVHFSSAIVVIAIVALLCRQSLGTARQRILFVAVLGIVLLGAVFFDWISCGRSLPLITAAGLALLFVRRRMDFSKRPQMFPILWMVFSLALLAKMGFHTRIWHYGFYLAMPAFAAAIYILLTIVPSSLQAYGVRVSLFRGSICLLLVLGVLRLAAQSNVFYKEKTFRIGQEQDSFYTYSPELDPASPMVAETVNWLRSHVNPEQTVAVLPEGAMLNYLSRRGNSAPFMVFNPAETATFGEASMLTRYQENPPDYVVLVHRDTSEFGVDFFGRRRGFGFEMMQWIRTNYTPVQLIGKEPLQNHLFGIKILQRQPKTGADPD